MNNDFWNLQQEERAEDVLEPQENREDEEEQQEEVQQEGEVQPEPQEVQNVAEDIEPDAERPEVGAVEQNGDHNC